MPATRKQSRSNYDVHPSLNMYQSSLAALKEKTGRSLAEWIKFVNKEGPETEKERRAWLKSEHGLGMNYAWWIAEQSLGKGADVKVCPCQTIVPLYRKHVFAQIKPTTRTRIDLGLALKDTKVPKRLIDTGGLAKKDRITHRIEITSMKDIDAEAKKWLKTAYEMDR